MGRPHRPWGVRGAPVGIVSYGIPMESHKNNTKNAGHPQLGLKIGLELGLGQGMELGLGAAAGALDRMGWELSLGLGSHWDRG